MMKLQTFVRKNFSLFVFLVVAFAVRWSLADQYYVPSGSMEPTIHIGDRILVNKMAYDFKLPYTGIVLAHTHEPNRGDIIVFENPKDSVTMVKRLIAIPGDQVVVDNGFVTINGQPIEGEHDGEVAFDQALSGTLATDLDTVTYHEHFGAKDVTIQRLPMMARPHHLEFIVPDGNYFAMGDNRDNSADSRVWGFVPRDHLKGRAFAVFWSARFENYVPHVDLQRTAITLN